MATTRTLLERTISEETKCSICCDQFKEPKMLPCQHTFCLKCLENVAKINDHNTVDCPLCRKVYKVPSRGGVGKFKSNLLMKKLLEAKGKTPSNASSSMTEDDKFERKSLSQGLRNNIVSTPSAPPLDIEVAPSAPPLDILNHHHHHNTSSQVINEEQINIEPRLLLTDTTSQLHEHSSSCKGFRSVCISYLTLLMLVGGIITLIIVLNSGQKTSEKNEKIIKAVVKPLYESFAL